MGVSMNLTRDTQSDQSSEVGATGGGPNTEEGKAVVRWNATRHGIRSPAPVVPGVEKAEEWEEHREGVLDNLSPVGHLEFVLAERVALLSWRLHRVIRYETESIALYQERAEDDLARERRFDSGPDHPEAVRGNAKSDRDDHRLLKRFAKMEEDKRLTSIEADLVIWSAMECADKVAEGEVEPEELLGSVSVPGLPSSDSWEGYEGWSAGLVRAVLEKVARATDEEPEELLEAAIRSAQWKAERSKLEAEKVERDLRNMARERLLPDEKTLEKVSRYEAHLSRLMFKALHELEALQVRRSGGAAPLARLDVDGLARD
jgi:hypothetical protein